MRFKNFAHRGLWHTAEEENTLVALERAFQEGFDVETDVRLWDGRFVIKHDPPLAGDDLPSVSGVLALLERYPYRHLALHFKYADWRDPRSMDIIDVLEPFADRVFLFDMSLAYCLAMKKKSNTVKVGVSVGDTQYHDAFCDLTDALESDVDVIWADENRQLYSQDFIETCHNHGKVVYAISPDLASIVGHPRAQEGYDDTWRDLIRWGVDGICTDKSRELHNVYVQTAVLNR